MLPNLALWLVTVVLELGLSEQKDRQFLDMKRVKKIPKLGTGDLYSDPSKENIENVKKVTETPRVIVSGDPGYFCTEWGLKPEKV